MQDQNQGRDTDKAEAPHEKLLLTNAIEGFTQVQKHLVQALAQLESIEKFSADFPVSMPTIAWSTTSELIKQAIHSNNRWMLNQIPLDKTHG